MVEVEVAGTRRQWMYDTGAEFTLLSKSLAEQLGVETVDPAFPLATSTSQTLSARFGVIDRLDVGGMSFTNLAVLVAPDETLMLATDEGTEVDMRAILSWNAIRHARTTVDYVDETFTMTVSSLRSIVRRRWRWRTLPRPRPGCRPLAR